MIDFILKNGPVFLLAASRALALLLTLPLFSSRTVNFAAKIALAFSIAFLVFPQLSLKQGNFSVYSPFISPEGNFDMIFVLLLAGEALIGVIIGFYIQIIFSAFSTAGQFFAFQMGFSASEVYDSLSQVENPLLGQYLNLIALLVFMQNNWLQRLFLKGLQTSFHTINAVSIVENSGNLMTFMLKSLTFLFKDALIIALPIMATLFLVNVAVGILGKAAPQMNLLNEGFPILILTSFFIILSLLPVMIDFFTESFEQGFVQIRRLLIKLNSGLE